ncbi:MAG TPA: fibronectin type III domain-containing protein, partial [Chitinispirillaceae bacterium]|nr:fibronectin type III domain-containing protein [Chitinispirillaceae bacterium]
CAVRAGVAGPWSDTWTFDLTTAVTGLWDVVVTNSDATSATLPNGFTVLPVPAPQPFSPIDSSNGNSLTPLLMWHKATDDSVYVLQLSTSNIFDGGFLLNNKQVIDTVEPIPPGILLSETWYHWRVAVIKKGGTTSDFSKEWRFETTYGTPAVPTLVYPLNNALNQDAPVHFFWQSRYNTDSSRIQVSTAADFRDTVMDSTSNNDTIVGNSLLKGNTYYWRVKAKNATGESDWSAVWSFSTLPAAPATVILDSPSDRNADIPINTTQLNWHKVPDATTYHLQIARDSIFTIIFKQDSALTDTITGCGALAYSTTYFWRVRAKNAGGAGEWSLFRRFTTVAPEAPPQVTLSAPLNGSINTPVAQLLRWTGIGSDITYHIQISDTSDFSYTRLDSSGIIADSMSASLWRNRLFYWRVCAVRAGVAGPWSDTWTFTTLPTVPDTVPVYTPPNQVNTPLNTTIVWGRVPGTVTFHVQIALDSLFISMLRNDSSFTDTVLNISGLENGTKYFWRVRASNAGGIGAWTSVVSFTTIVALPAIQTLQQLTIGDSVRVDTAVIKWSAGYPVADRYWLEYGTDSTFTNTFQDSSLADTTMVLRNLSNDITVYWRIKAHNVAGWGAWSAVSLFRVRIPTVGLMRSIPKNYTFTISGHNGCFMYTLPSAELVSFKLYDIKGRVRKELVNKHQTPGFYKLLLNDNTFASGTYLLKFRAGKFSTKKTLTIFH